MNRIGFVALLAYIFCALWRPQDYILFLFEMPILFALEMLVLLSWLFGPKRFDAPQYKLLLLFWLSVVISRVLYAGVSMGIATAQNFFLDIVLIFIFIANAMTTLDRQRIFVRVFVLGTLIMALHSVDQSLDPDKIGWTGQQMLLRSDSADTLWQTRYVGIFADPNDLGMALVCALPFLVYLYVSASNVLSKLGVILSLIVHVYAIYLTNSRGTMLAVGAMAGSWGLLRYGGIRLVLPVLGIGAILPVILPARVFLSGDSSSQERIDAWYQGTQMFLANPLFGVGQGAFLSHHEKTAHNSWVLAFAELGFTGFYFWVALLFSSFYLLWVCQKDVAESIIPTGDLDAYNRERRMASAVMFAMIGTLACAFFLSRTYIILMYILPALAVAQYHRYQYKFSNVQFQPMALHMVWLSGMFLVLVNLVVRVNT